MQLRGFDEKLKVPVFCESCHGLVINAKKHKQ